MESVSEEEDGEGFVQEERDTTNFFKARLTAGGGYPLIDWFWVPAGAAPASV